MTTSEDMDAKEVAHESLYGDGQPGDNYLNVTRYMADASRTASGVAVHDELVTPAMVKDAIDEALISVKHLDAIKKALFYGREDADLAFSRKLREDESFDGIDIDLLHGIIGLYTEAGELLEVLRKIIVAKDFDRSKVVDETGDSMWYQHLILKAVGSDFEEAARLNIEKLKARYPVKFTEDLAVNRNEAKENAVFE